MATASAGTGPVHPTDKKLKLTLKNIKYLHPSAAAKQITGAFESLVLIDLKHSFKEYTFDDGRKEDLMQLTGSVSLVKELKVLIRILLPKGFPKEKPMVQIVMDSGMELKSVDYVDTRGRITVPYLSEWKEAKSNISTLTKIIKLKFEQNCPVHQSEAGSFRFKFPSSSSSSSTRSTLKTRKSDSTLLSDHYETYSGHMREMEKLRNELTSNQRELLSYEKTIGTLTEELDGFRAGVKELEQVKKESLILTRERGISLSAGSKMSSQEDIGKELEVEREEKESCKKELAAEKEKLQKEINEKEKIKHRLDSKISDLTQTREKIAILEVERDDYHQRLQRTSKELKRCKHDIRELVTAKHNMKAELLQMELKLDNIRKLVPGTSDLERNTTENSERSLGESNSNTEQSESEKNDGRALNLTVEHFESEQQTVEKEETSETDGDEEKEELRAVEKEDTSTPSSETDGVGEKEELRMEETCACLEPIKVEDSQSEDNIQPASSSPLLRDLAHGQTQTDLIPYSDSQIQVESDIMQMEEIGTQVDHMMGSGVDKEVQTTTAEFDSEEEERRELERQITRSLKEKLEDAEAKIHQLLGIKDRLSNKNEVLKRVIEDQSQSGNSTSNSNEEELKKVSEEKEEIKRAYSEKIKEMKSMIEGTRSKVKLQLKTYVTKIIDLQTELDGAQRKLREKESSRTNILRGPTRISERNIINFMELQIMNASKLEKGCWGYSVEGILRGKEVVVRCVSKESMARFSIDQIHEQIKNMADIRHPNLVTFIGVVMDIPSGMIFITELLSYSLKQAYEARLIKPDKLPVLFDIALALNFLHLQRNTLTHNNLSSCNIMVEEVAGNKWRAKLSNRSSKNPLMELSDLEERPFIYLPPESRSEGKVIPHDINAVLSPYVDVYSYGVLLCEVTTNSLPESMEELLRLLLGITESLPQLFCLIKACLSSCPTQRPSMGTLVTKIKNLVVNNITVA